MLHNATYFVAKSRQEYRCEKCDYNTCKRGDWNKHLETKKHKTREMLHNATDFVAKKSPKLWRCECGKVYKHHTSYYRHKNQCTQRALSEHVTPNMDGMKDLMVSMVEENRELRAILLDQQKQLAGWYYNTFLTCVIIEIMILRTLRVMYSRFSWEG